MSDERPQEAKAGRAPSIFDDKFQGLWLPIEILQRTDLTIYDIAILARVIYWTEKGLPCRHSNKQFGELIRKHPGTAARSVYKLIALKLVDAHYVNVKASQHKDGYRDLTALVGVDAERILKRKTAQLGQHLFTKDRQMQGKEAKSPHKQEEAPPLSASAYPPKRQRVSSITSAPARKYNKLTNTIKRAKPKREHPKPPGIVLNDEATRDEAQRQKRLLLSSQKRRVGGGKKLQTGVA